MFDQRRWLWGVKVSSHLGEAWCQEETGTTPHGKSMINGRRGALEPSRRANTRSEDEGLSFGAGLGTWAQLMYSYSCFEALPTPRSR